MKKPYALCIIDAQNLWYIPKRKGRRIDWWKLKRVFTDRYYADIYAYLVFDPIHTACDGFVKYLTHIGINPRVKFMTYDPETQQAGNTNWDDEMIAEAGEMVEGYQALIIVSGDHGFCDLIIENQAAGRQVEVASFPQCLSSLTKCLADKVTILNGDIFMDRKKQ